MNIIKHIIVIIGCLLIGYIVYELIKKYIRYKKYSKKGVLKSMAKTKQARAELLSVCGEHVKNVLLEEGTDWLTDINSFGINAKRIKEKIEKAALKDGLKK